MSGRSNRWRYDIRWIFSTKGVVEAQDVIGALYHEMKSLGSDLSLDELEENGEIDGVSLLGLESEDGVTEGTIKVRCDVKLGKAAEIGAALETVDQIGPCEAEIEVRRIKPIMEERRKFIKNRAREIIENLGSNREVKS